MIPALLLAADDLEISYRIGQVIGFAFWFLLGSIGFIKSLRISRRPTTNTAAAVALALLFAAAFSNSLLSVVSNFASVPSWANYIGLGLGIALMIAAIVLGIVGLTQIAILKDRFNQGKAQAIWAISLSSLFLLVIVGGGILQSRSAFQALAHRAANDPSPSLASNAESKPAPATPAPAEPSADPVYEVHQQFNYRIAVPERPWSKMEPSNVNPVAKTAFFRPRPQTLFMVIPEVYGVETTVNPAAFIDVVKANLTSVAANVTFTEPVPEIVNGIPGHRLNADCLVGMQPVAYSYWIAVHNGFGYQVITAMQHGTMEEAEATGIELTQGFQINDPNYVAHDPNANSVDPFVEPHLEYALNLYPQGWLDWPNHDQAVPEADFAAHFENILFLFTASVPHPGLAPSYPDLKTAFLENSFSLTENAIRVHREALVQTPAGEALEMDFAYDGDGFTHRVVAHLYRRGDYSLFHCVYLETEYANDVYLTKTRAALDQLAFTDNAPRIPTYRALLDAGRADYQRHCLNDIGIRYYNNDNYQKARDYFAAAFAQGESDGVILSNLILALNFLGEYGQAIDAYEPHRDAFPDTPSPHASAAAAYYQSGQPDQAAALYQTLFNDGYVDDDDFLDYLNALIDLSRRPDAIEATRAYIDRTESWQAKRWLASMLGDHGDYDEAAALLATLKQARPFDRQVDLDRAELDFKFEKHNAVIASIDEMNDIADDDSRFLALRGKAHYHLESYVKAKRDFEAALALNPSDDDLKSWLAYTANALGLGDQEVRKTEIPPVELPDGIRSQIVDTRPNATNVPQDESHYDYSIVSFDYAPGSHYKKTIRESIYIGDEAALDQYQTLSISYDPFAEEVFLNAAEVIDREGRTIAQAKLEDCYVTTDNSSEMAIEDKQLNVPVPGLQIGHTIRTVYTRLRQGVPDPFPFEDVYFIRSRPVETRAAVVKAPENSYRSAASGPVETFSADGLDVWVARDTRPYVWEPYQDRFDNFVPRLELSGEQRPWSELARNYLADIRGKLELDEATRQLARDIVADAESDRDKVYSVYRYIQKNFTYKAIEFGPRGRIPNDAATIVANRYGDCKDLALLARQLLQANGIEAHLALVHSRDALNPELASLDQFDHMILYVPELDQGRFFDCTTADASPQMTTPLGLDDQVALVLDPEKPRLAAIPPASAAANRIATDRSIRIDGPHLLVSETFSASGSVAAYFRSYLKSFDSTKRQDALQDYMAKLESDLQLERFEHHHLNDPTQDLKLVFEYRAPNRVETEEDGSLLLRLPAVWERDYFAVGYLKERKTPFKIFSGIELEGSTVLELADGQRLSTSPKAWNQKDANAFHEFSCQLKAPRRGQAPSIAHRLAVKSGVHQPERYADFADSAQQALNGLSRTLRVSVATDD